MIDTASIELVWEEKYAGGHAQRYPWDAIVSFIFRNAPRDRPRDEVRIVEVGCGTAANLWFAAREGFSVAGIDGSPTAINAAKKRFAEEKLSGDFRVGDFTQLPFPDNSFDIGLDRGALTCAGLSAGKKAIAELRRVLKSGALLFFNPYSDRHDSRASGRLGMDGLTLEISAGTMVGVGPICFYSAQQLRDALTGWTIRSIQHVEWTDIEPKGLTHAEWRVVAQCNK
jgi:ubiquinone/menaquinone biosynthesis C-methylase UbiE